MIKPGRFYLDCSGYRWNNQSIFETNYIIGDWIFYVLIFTFFTLCALCKTEDLKKIETVYSAEISVPFQDPLYEKYLKTKNGQNTTAATCNQHKY